MRCAACPVHVANRDAARCVARRTDGWWRGRRQHRSRAGVPPTGRPCSMSMRTGAARTDAYLPGDVRRYGREKLPVGMDSTIYTEKAGGDLFLHFLQHPPVILA